MVMPKVQLKKSSVVYCMCTTLPRPPEPSGIIMLKLKRKSKYRGHQYHESVRPAIVYDDTFNYLKITINFFEGVNIAISNINNELVNFENTGVDCHRHLSQLVNSLHETSHDIEFLDNPEINTDLGYVHERRTMISHLLKNLQILETC